MRHGKRINHLGRKSAHRKAMLANMATSLIMHKRINTTVAKAKELRKYVEPLITKSKADTTHSRRIVFSYLQNKDAVSELFREVASKVGERPGGYTRIIKTGNRLGDNAEMCLIELVDYNDLYTIEKKSAGKKRTRRSRRGGGTGTTEGAKATETNKDTAAEKAAEATVDKKVEATATEEKAEAPKAETATEVKEVSTEASAKEEATTKEEEPKVEATKEEAPEAKAEVPAPEEKKEETKTESPDESSEAKAKDEASEDEEKKSE